MNVQAFIVFDGYYSGLFKELVTVAKPLIKLAGLNVIKAMDALLDIESDSELSWPVRGSSH